MVLAYSQMHDMGAGAWLFMTLGGLLVVCLLIGIVASLIRGRESAPSDQTARELLDLRLADGTIDVEEYERLRDAMRPPGSARPAHQ